MGKEKYIVAVLRISLGFIFLWSFFDKLFGLGFSTLKENAWIYGGSPTLGYLSFGTYGPLASFFQSIAGTRTADWLFMLGLAFVGVTLILGIIKKLSVLSGSLMMFFIWLSALPPKNNPFLDEHIIYILILLIILASDSTWSLEKYWRKLGFVKKLWFLR